MISASNQQLQQQLEYTLLKPYCHSWWISKMQSGREEEQYTIKFCFKLGKMPKKRMECFRLLFDHLAWIEHQFLSGIGDQFLSGIRDSRKAGSLWVIIRGVGGVRMSIHQSWEAKGFGLGLLCQGFKGVQEEIPSEEASTLQIRTPELIGQIKNFMDKNRCMSIETINTHNHSWGTEDAEDLCKVCTKGRRSERKTLSWQQGDGRADQFRSRSSWCSGGLQWKLDLLLWPRDQETEFPEEEGQSSQTQEGQTEQIHPQTFDDPFFDSTDMIYMHWVPTGQTVNKVEVLREFRKRFRRKRPALFKSGQWHFHQDNAPVHNSILVTDYLTKMGIKTVPQPPYSTTLSPYDFWLFPKLRVRVRVRDNWGDERVCNEGHWYAHTRGLLWGLPEVVGMVQQVHWRRRRLLRRGQEFQVCIKSAHLKKVWKLI